MKYFILGLAVILSACASCRVTSEQLQSANYGSVAGDMSKEIKEITEPELIDPWSVAYKFNVQASNSDYICQGKEPIFGYWVYAGVNAKNHFGGYTGWQRYRFFVKDGKILEHSLAF